MAALEIRIEKTNLAQELEKTHGLDFSLSQKHKWDAGYDVRACIPFTTFIAPGERKIIPIGLKIELLSEVYEIQCRPRSGLAAKYGIMIVNSPGTIDAGYKDEIMVILYNSGKNNFKVEPGDRIAQLCFRAVPSLDIYYVDAISREDDRGGGFGSSGVK